MNASLSLDLDDKWSYMMVHGDPEWQTLPSYIDIVVPRFLEVLDAHRLKITVFVVGKDAERPCHQEALRAIVRAGHEIGNHSYSHEPWLHKQSREAIESEIRSAEEAIERAVGVRPIGFRGPGYARSSEILDILASRSYLYDASVLSTWIGPLARAYYLRSTRLSSTDAEERNELFGSLWDGFGPNRLRAVATPSGSIAVVPVTTMPLMRIPIHLSYVMHLRTISRTLAEKYMRCALHACRFTGTEPSLLLHPLDFVNADEAPELRFFPGMQLSIDEKSETMNDFLKIFASMFGIQPIRDRVQARYVREGQPKWAVQAGPPSIQ